MKLRPPVALGAVLGLLAISGAGGVTLWSARVHAKAPAGAAPPAPTVKVVEAVQRALPETAEYNGRLTAVETVELRARVGGYLAAIRFQEGGLVQQGQVLFELEAGPFEAAAERAEAQLRQAEERRALARRRAARGEKLLPKGAIAQEEYDRLASEHAESEAVVASARAVLRAARIELSDTKVRAPISGRIGNALVTRGNLVTAGATRLATLVSADPMHVYFDIDEPTSLRLARAAPGRTPAGQAGAPVSILIGDEGAPRSARLDFLGNRLDPTTGTIRARAVLPNRDGVLSDGLFARVRLQTEAPVPRVLVPDPAVRTDSQGRYVLVVKADRTLEPRRVRLGGTVEGLRMVREGLSAGERVVIHGQARPGTVVNPELVASATEVRP